MISCRGAGIEACPPGIWVVKRPKSDMRADTQGIKKGVLDWDDPHRKYKP